MLTILIIFFSIQSVEASGKITSGSSIANVPLEGLTFEEATEVLTDQVTKWYAKDVLILSSEYQVIEIPRTAFQFNIEGSVRLLEERMKRHWSNLFMKQKNVHLPLIVQINEEELPDLPDYIDLEKTVSELISVAEQLGDQKIAIEYRKDPSELQKTVAEIVFPMPNNISEAVTNNLIDQINGLVIRPNETFSFMESIDLLDAATELETSFIASGVYALALESNMEVLERHSQRTIPSYTEAGIEALVNYKTGKDLILYNPSRYSYSIAVNVQEDQVIFTLKSISSKKPKQYSIEFTETVKPKTIYRYSPYLPYDTEEIIQGGSNGAKVTVERQVKGENEHNEIISTDFYPPRPTVILKSSASEPEESETEMTEQDIANLFNNFSNNTESLETETIAEEEKTTNEQRSTDEADMEESPFNHTGMTVDDIFYLCVLEDASEGLDHQVSYCDLLSMYFLLNLIDDETLTDEVEENEVAAANTESQSQEQQDSSKDNQGLEDN